MQKLDGHMDLLKKNPRYKVLEVQNQYYLVDLLGSLFSYIFPMINWFPKHCYKISEAEYRKLHYDLQNQSSNYGVFAGGVGVFIAVLLRPLMDLTNIQINIWTASITILLTLIAIVSLHIVIRKKNSLANLQKDSLPIKIKIIPNIKVISIIIFLYIMFLFISILGFYTFLILQDLNIVFYIIWIGALIYLTCLNILSIKAENVKVKIY